MNEIEPSSLPPTGVSPSDAPDDNERRAALRKLGGLAAWTAPVTVTLMVTPRAQAISSPPPPPGSPEWMIQRHSR
jgi:hypothetical protein